MFPRVSNLKMVFTPTSALLRAWCLFRLVLVTINKTTPSTAEYCVMLCGNACEHSRRVRCQRLFTWWCRQYRRSCFCRFRALASSLQNGTVDQLADLVQAVLSGRSDSNRRSQAHLTPQRGTSLVFRRQLVGFPPTADRLGGRNPHPHPQIRKCRSYLVVSVWSGRFQSRAA
jgi:hypothetical protein